jgi:hypothetical protein
MLAESAGFLSLDPAATALFGPPAVEQRLAGRNWSLAVACHRRLIDSAEPLAGYETPVRTLATAGLELDLLERVPAPLWARLPLPGHVARPWPAEVREAVAAALAHIAAVHPGLVPLVRTFLRNLVWLEAGGDGAAGEPLITSLSLPTLPFTAFVSRKALVHIPPGTVATAGSPRLLAENLAHEAVHQLVNTSLLSQDLLADDYDAASSPRIPIHWRFSQGIARNMYWELDRVLHAIAVYVALLSWRCDELGSGPAGENRWFAAALREAIPAVDYLVERIGEHAGRFTARGQALLGALGRDARAAIGRARALLHDSPGVEADA